MSDLHRVEWKHPHHGTISETLCWYHEGEVLAALRTLGIGCGGAMERSRSVCTRCVETDRPVRAWIADYAAEPVLP